MHLQFKVGKVGALVAPAVLFALQARLFPNLVPLAFIARSMAWQASVPIHVPPAHFAPLGRVLGWFVPLEVIVPTLACHHLCFALLTLSSSLQEQLNVPVVPGLISGLYHAHRRVLLHRQTLPYGTSSYPVWLRP